MKQQHPSDKSEANIANILTYSSVLQCYLIIYLVYPWSYILEKTHVSLNVECGCFVSWNVKKKV